MPRPKAYTDDQMMALVNDYHLKYPELYIKASELADYGDTHGYPNIKPYSIRRSKKVWKYISDLNEDNNASLQLTVVTWEMLDVDEFLAKNNSHGKLKQAIRAREQYYAEACRAAGTFLKEKKSLEAKNLELQSQINTLNQQIESLKNANTNKINKQSAEMLVRMKAVLDRYVYPDIANNILKKEGLDMVFESIIMPSSIKEQMLAPYYHVDLDKDEKNIDEGMRCIDDLIGGLNDE